MATIMRPATVAVDECWTQVIATQRAERATDLGLIDEIKRALRAATYPALARVDVLASDGCVVLRGIVPSYHVKQVAQEIAMCTAKVEAVNNELRVGGAGRCEAT
jgi:osmotically-inducible protein OsmY